VLVVCARRGRSTWSSVCWAFSRRAAPYVPVDPRLPQSQLGWRST
jgi:hypothetical protein